ncbi:protein-cysteine N-palmitoyltransferase HHAT-like isoform X2 [Lineus longissimus]
MEKKHTRRSDKSTCVTSKGGTLLSCETASTMTSAVKEAEDNASKMFIRSAVPLPQCEICFYFIVWGIMAGLMVIYCVVFSWEYQWEMWPKSIFRRSDFAHGWVDGQLQDVSEFEWNFWFRLWSPCLILWVVGHSVISAIASKFLTKYKLHIWTIYAMSAVTYVLGFKSMLILLLHCIIAYFSSITGLPAVVWATIVLLISTLNMNTTTEHFKTFFPDDARSGNASFVRFHLLLFSTAMFDMRLASFCLERCNKKDGDSGYSFIDMLAYVFYLPLMYTGPILTYEKFRMQVSSFRPWTKEDVINITKKFIQQVVYIVLIEYHLHYFYYSSMSHNFAFLQKISSGETVVLLYCKVMFFYLKYLPLFGVPSLFASLDQIQTPKGPACVSRISNFSEVWKTFDRGFYSFITQHIYIPLGGSRMGTGKQLLAVSACFGYIYIWHGTEYHLFIWAVVNYAGVLLEIMGRSVSNFQSIRKIEARYLSNQMSRRLMSLACIPSLCMSLLGVIYFFDGEVIGNVFFRKIVKEGPWMMYLTILLTLYCGCNASFEAWNWDMEKAKKKQS